MQGLQELVMRLGPVTLGEINEAIFNSPDTGLLESLRRFLDPARAEALFDTLARHLNVDLINDSDVQISKPLFEANSAPIERLAKKYKVIPLDYTDLSGEKAVRLAMSNPLNRDALAAFHDLLGVTIVPCLARESAIVSAIEAVATRSAPSTPRIDGEEDPHVSRAIHQLLATAVKHRALRVEIDLEHERTRAVFCFSDGRMFGVEVGVGPEQLLGGMLRRGQLLSRSKASVEAACRVQFKASSVDCHACYRQSHVLCDATSELTPGRALVIGEFVIDAPDDPNVWRGMAEADASRLRAALRPANGILVVGGRDRAEREALIMALSAGYPDLQVVRASAKWDRRTLLERASSQRILLEVAAAAHLEALLTIGLDAHERKLLRAVVLFGTVSRLCPFCSISSPLPQSVIERLAQILPPAEIEPRAPRGCGVCLESGYAGRMPLVSIFDPASPSGRTYLAGVPVDEVAEAIDALGPRSIPESALIALGRGLTSLKIIQPVIRELLHKPAPVKEERAERRSATEQRIEGAAMPAPIRGSGVFLAGRARDCGVEPIEPPTLLVIEDDPDQRAILRQVFELEGYRVEVAADGVDGLVSANRLKPSIILVDAMMPQLDGRDTIGKLRAGAATAKIPIVVLTAVADPAIELELLQAGADDYCLKSVSKRVLLKRVERALQRSRRS